MKYLKTSSLLFLIVIFILGCSKTEEPVDPPVNPPGTPNPDKPAGIIYLKVEGDITKINANDSSIIWTSANRNLFGSAGNPLTFDSTAFYHGNHSGLTAYSTQTGTPRWYFSWIAFSDAISYRQPAFKDSLVFVAVPPANGIMHTCIVLIKVPVPFVGKKKLTKDMWTFHLTLRQ